MAIPAQTIALLGSARQLAGDLRADAILLLTETALDWDTVREELNGFRLLVAAHSESLTADLKERDDYIVLKLDPEPVPIQERMSLALLKAIAKEQLQPGSHVVVLYN